MAETYKSSNKVRDKSLVSLSVYNVGSQKCPPGYQWGPGVRDHYLIHYIISGEGSYTAKGRTEKLRAGDVFCVFPGEEITYRADTDTPWEYQWVGFAGVDAASMMGATGFSKKNLVMRQIPFGSELLVQLRRIEAAFGNSYAASIRMTGELCLALCLFLDARLDNAPRKSSEEALRDSVSKALTYIKANYSHEISITDVANYAGVSRSTLYRQFVKYMNQTPQEYLESFRLNRARALLIETPLSIRAIANSVGISNAMYFSRIFRKGTGLTPTRYRENPQAENPDFGSGQETPRLAQEILSGAETAPAGE
ncbi:AraC family transcriptional regulator [Clostridium vitabionis]|uniref:AraC family transcriptional regulator n=1 Tax=Clostridium vitabionis TaxID=2784388 RepID=UPI00188D61C5|nr:AraC family transcriptional regulator [Clostridium vitabionis]